MKKNINFSHMLSVGVLVAAVATASAVLFSGRISLAQEEALSTDFVAGVSSGVGADVLNLLSDLKLISLNEAIFQDQAFKSLQDNSVEIPAELKGRNNPFAPIGEEAPLATTTRQ